MPTDIAPQDYIAELGGWQGLLPADFTVEHQGRPTPVRDLPFVKEAKDLPAFVKSALAAHSEVGARVRVPGKDATPEQLASFRKAAYEAGVFTAPPATPAEYGIVKPADLPEGVTWNEPLAQELATTLHKHGIPRAAVGDLLALHQKVIEGAGAAFKTSLEEGMVALKREHGDQFDARMAAAGRLAKAVFKTPEELALVEAAGLGNHPGFLGVLMRLAPLAEQDSSFVAEMNRASATGQTADSVRAELGKIMGDPAHPMHQGWKRRDPTVLTHVDGLYRSVYGSEPVEIR